MTNVKKWRLTHLVWIEDHDLKSLSLVSIINIFNKPNFKG